MTGRAGRPSLPSQRITFETTWPRINHILEMSCSAALNQSNAGRGRLGHRNSDCDQECRALPPFFSVDRGDPHPLRGSLLCYLRAFGQGLDETPCGAPVINQCNWCLPFINSPLPCPMCSSGARSPKALHTCVEHPSAPPRPQEVVTALQLCWHGPHQGRYGGGGSGGGGHFVGREGDFLG